MGFASREPISHGAQLLSQFAHAMLTFGYRVICVLLFHGNNLFDTRIDILLVKKTITP